jgi:NADH-quinone oxidoreductase subunit G
MSEQKLVTFKINDRELQVPAGTLVIEAAKQIATEVPSFCYYPGLSLQAACRMCLVEVEKMPKMQTACTLVATDGQAGPQGRFGISADQPSPRLPGMR